MRSILLHIYEDVGLEARLQSALDLARAFGGHLTCLHATPYEDYLAADPVLAAVLPVEFSNKMERRREELRARLEARLASEGVSWDWAHVDEQVPSALIRFSALADIVVTSLAAAPALEKQEARSVAATVAIHGRAPVLAVPQNHRRLRLDVPVIVAWNGSAEAAAALRGALPLLKAAPNVYVLEVEEQGSAYPRDLAARYLSRHDIHVDIVERACGAGSVSEVICRVALELGAGLIVMGAYGRSRLRELIVGGVTRSMLGQSTLPLLLTH